MDDTTLRNPSIEHVKVNMNGTLTDYPVDELRHLIPHFAWSKLSRHMRKYPEHWSEFRFSDFATNPVMNPIAVAVKQWNHSQPNTCSILSVQNGIGKTHMSVCSLKSYIYNKAVSQVTGIVDKEGLSAEKMQQRLADWQAEPTVSAIFTSEADLLKDIQEAYDNKNVSEMDKMYKYLKAGFLVIDDVFAGKVSDFSRRILLEILDKRSERYNLPTLINSNLLLPQIADIDTRIADRLRGAQMHQIKDLVESYRKQR